MCAKECRCAEHYLHYSWTISIEGYTIHWMTSDWEEGDKPANGIVRSLTASPGRVLQTCPSFSLSFALCVCTMPWPDHWQKWALANEHKLSKLRFTWCTRARSFAGTVDCFWVCLSGFVCALTTDRCSRSSSSLNQFPMNTKKRRVCTVSVSFCRWSLIWSMFIRRRAFVNDQC